MFIIQRIHEGAGDKGQDIRETLARGFADPDAALKHLRDQFKDDPKDPDEIDIEVDGGMDKKNLAKASEAGATLFVSGTYLQKSENPEQAYEELKEIEALRRVLDLLEDENLLTGFL